MGRFWIYISLMAALWFAAMPGAAAAAGLGDKAGLQAALQRHIDRQTVAGVYLHLDSKTGEVRNLHPVTPHPMILSMGEHFVLCFDFRDDQGKHVDVDFYLARKDRSFVVFHAAVDDRQLLEGLMATGRIGRAE